MAKSKSDWPGPGLWTIIVILVAFGLAVAFWPQP